MSSENEKAYETHLYGRAFCGWCISFIGDQITAHRSNWVLTILLPRRPLPAERGEMMNVIRSGLDEGATAEDVIGMLRIAARLLELKGENGGTPNVLL